MVTVTGSTSCRGRRGGADGAPTSRRGGAGGVGSRGRRGGAGGGGSRGRRGKPSRGRRGGADGGAALLVVLKHLNSRALDSTQHALHDVSVNFFFFGGDALQHLLGFPNRFRSCCFCSILH